MPCYSPVRAYRKAGAFDSSTGKWPLTFKKAEGWKETALDVPCGKCDGCRMDYARSWAIRCMHEASLHNRNCVVTLTYDQENVPYELDKRGMQNWLKVLRSHIGSFRYFGCGEYGCERSRPHYHVIIFGYDFPDKVCVTNHLGHKQYDSAMLREIWGKGHVSVGEVSFASAAYIARYCFKKQLSGAEKGDKQPEYLMMSNRPGIGAGWVGKFADDLVSAMCVVSADGQRYKIPKYYESRLSEADLRQIKVEALKRQVLESPVRTLQRWECAHSALHNYQRSFEHD